ncbi:MAG: hypothetical protein RJB38_142 [Pseudomonadota bacterium]|jgi:hypothetical protein
MRHFSILLALAVVTVAGALSIDKNRTNNHAMSSLRFAASYFIRADSIDPAKPLDLATYQALASLFSRLVYFKEANKLELMAAEHFEWSGATLRIKVKRWKTRDGYEISARDAAFSLRRLLILDSNSHGFIKDLLCPGEQVRDPTVDCRGIATDGDQLVLSVEDPRKKKFLLPLLANADYSIIPIPSVDTTKPNLPIIDYRNTSGPFYSDLPRPDKILRAQWNPNFFWDRGNRAETVSFSLFPDGFQAIQAATQGQIDIISKDFFLSPEAISLAVASKSLKVSATEPIEQLRIYVTNPGLKNFSRKSRAFALIEAFHELKKIGYIDETCTLAHSLFPPSSLGDLNPNQIKTIEDERRQMLDAIASASQSALKPKGIFWAFGDPRFQKSISGKHVSLFERSSIKNSKITPEDFTIQVLPVDSAFYEDISLLSYEFSGDRLGLNTETGRQWLSDYMAIEDDELRIARLKEFQFNALKEWMVLPICMRPYYVLHQTNIVDSTPRLMASSPWWMFSKNK